MISSTTRNNRPGPGPHRTDTLSLVFGLIFVGLAGSWAAQHFLDLHWNVDWDLPHLGWIVAGALVLLGLLGILASIRRDNADLAAPPVEVPPTPPTPTGVAVGPPARPYRMTDDVTTEPVDPVRGTDRPE